MNNKHESVGKWVSILDRYMQKYIAREVKQYGLGPAQYNFLMLILRKEGASQDVLCQKLNVDKTNATRVLKRLEQLQFIQRVPCEQDRRINRVYTTEKAKKVEQELIMIRKRWTNILIQDVSATEQQILFNLLNRMTNNAIQYIHHQDEEER